MSPKATKTMKTYNENDFSNDGLKEIDSDTGEVRERDLPKSPIGELIKWAETRIGKKFVNRGKQGKLIKYILQAGYKLEEIKVCWEELEKDEFWGEKGIDFGIVYGQISKVKTKEKAGVTIIS